MFAVEYLPAVVEKDIPALPKTMKQRIRAAIETRLTADPIGFGKPLQYSLKGHRRLRVGDHHVVFRLNAEKHLVTIVAIAHRKDIYETNAN